ncbi:MAG: 1-acyl-sn-glycerol-3-phosphate acyltransferase [Rhodospirillales bacterium]|nr:MAG: 1-acyl-sn-glycerol-3-phosphate acyltransferase [Rhodospirillales bacterium]
MRSVLAVLRLTLFLAGTLLLLPPHLLARAFFGSLALTRVWHAFTCAVFSIRVTLLGAPTGGAARARVFVCNHLSYLDIVVLGAHLDGVFVAKSEVAGWPGFGFLAKTQDTIFLVRRAHGLEAGRRAVADALRAGRNIILFGEGTSTDGRAVRPIKPSLLEVLYDEGVAASVQPVAIVLERAGGHGMADQAARDLYAWWRAEDTLAPHLWRFARAGGADVTLDFLPALDPAAFAGRKALAQRVTQDLAGVLAAASPS